MGTGKVVGEARQEIRKSILRLEMRKSNADWGGVWKRLIGV